MPCHAYPYPALALPARIPIMHLALCSCPLATLALR